MPRPRPSSAPGPSRTAATSPRSRSIPTPASTQIVNYIVVDDFGVVLNPMLVEGQVHGGVVQGIGQALLEHAVYDDSGQLLTGSFMDYAMPRADNMPSFALLDRRGAVQEQRDGREGLRRGGLGRRRPRR